MGLGVCAPQPRPAVAWEEGGEGAVEIRPPPALACSPRVLPARPPARPASSFYRAYGFLYSDYEDRCFYW